MEYTWDAYRLLVQLIKDNGYVFSNFIDYISIKKVCIMRHDIDFDIEKAVIMSNLDYELGVKSIYFVLINYPLYDALNETSIINLKRIIDNKCEIGLHFDASKFDTYDEMERVILQYRDLLENRVLVGSNQNKIRFISYHIPNEKLLNLDNEIIAGLINVYSKKYFSGFKYISDSGHRWREDPIQIIRSREYDRLQCLTHPIWYYDDNKDLKFVFNELVKGDIMRKEYVVNNFKCFKSIEDK